MDLEKLSYSIEAANIPFKKAKESIHRIVIGQENMIDRLFIALLAGGHILLEGLPGLAKTLAVKTLAKVIDCRYTRIQFTPDLLPADLIGTSIYDPKENIFSVHKGPIFTNILLADEINRAPAKVQSALLEAMQERQVTISGTTFSLESPFLVLATQNPIEQEGTYPLPEAQTDRFMMKVKVDYPTYDEEKVIIHQVTSEASTQPSISPLLTKEHIALAQSLVKQVYVDEKIIDYILRIVTASRQPEEMGVPIDGLLAFGASPRASIALKICGQAHAFLNGRAYVSPYDIKNIAHEVLRHRLRTTFEAEAQETTTDNIIDTLLNHLYVP